jgi:hypothetical protein
MSDPSASKRDLVWAAVFLSAISTVGLTLLLTFGGYSSLDNVTAVLLIAGWTLSVFAVVLLLTVPGQAAGLLVAGRVLAWLIFATLGLASVFGVLSIVGVG